MDIDGVSILLISNSRRKIMTKQEGSPRGEVVPFESTDLRLARLADALGMPVGAIVYLAEQTKLGREEVGFLGADAIVGAFNDEQPDSHAFIVERQTEAA